MMHPLEMFEGASDSIFGSLVFLFNETLSITNIFTDLKLHHSLIEYPSDFCFVPLENCSFQILWLSDHYICAIIIGGNKVVHGSSAGKSSLKRNFS